MLFLSLTADIEQILSSCSDLLDQSIPLESGNTLINIVLDWIIWQSENIAFAEERCDSLCWWFGKHSSMQLRNTTFSLAFITVFNASRICTLSPIEEMSSLHSSSENFIQWHFHQSGSSDITDMIGFQIADNSIYIIVWYFWFESFELQTKTGAHDISRISPRIDWIFSWEALIHFLVLKEKDFRNFVLHDCILVFYDEQVYLELQVINIKNKEITVSKPHRCPSCQILFHFYNIGPPFLDMYMGLVTPRSRARWSLWSRACERQLSPRGWRLHGTPLL